jgi:hypothetical protein
VLVVSGYGDADRLAEDRSSELALLQVHGAGDLVPAALAADAAQAPDLTAVGIADPQDQGGGSALSTAAVKLKGETLEPAPQPGFSGAAALDPQGRVVGMVALRMPVIANVGATPAQPQATMVPAAIIRMFLTGQGVAPTLSTRTGLDAAKAALVRVICVRK